MNYLNQAYNDLVAAGLQLQQLAYTNIVRASNYTIYLVSVAITPLQQLATVAVNAVFSASTYLFNNILLPIINVFSNGLKYVFENLVQPIFTVAKNALEHLAKLGVDLLTLVINKLSPVVTAIINAVSKLINNSINKIIDAVTYIYNNLLSPIFTAIRNGVERLAKISLDALTYAYNNFLSPILTVINNGLERLAKISLDAFTYVYNNLLSPILTVINKGLDRLVRISFDALTYIYNNVLSPIITVINKGLEHVVRFSMDAINFVYKNMLSPIITVVKQVPGMIVDGVETLGKAVLSVVGLPVFAYNRFSGQESVPPAETTEEDMRKISLAVGAATLLLVGYAISRYKSTPAVPEQSNSNIDPVIPVGSSPKPSI